MITPKDLKALIKVMRKEGITRIKMDGLEFELGHVETRKRAKPQSVKEQVQDAIETDGLTDEELLFYSAGGGLPVGDN